MFEAAPLRSGEGGLWAAVGGGSGRGREQDPLEVKVKPLACAGVGCGDAGGVAPGSLGPTQSRPLAHPEPSLQE